MKEISGGVCAATGFRANAAYCGVKGKGPEKPDVALILSEQECAAAAVYTLNRVKAAPLYVTMEHLENGCAWGVVVNSGCANACCPKGHENAQAMCAAAAQATGREAEDFAVASTGVIGQALNISAIEAGIPGIAAGLSPENSGLAAEAIMTTDRNKKEIALSLELGGKEVKIGAIAKGSSMIHPNMGTMLCFVTTDCAITHQMLEEALRDVTARTFNRVVVDGDSSSNDMCVALANAMAGNPLIEWKDEDYETFVGALETVCTHMARAIAADGTGSTKLITCQVRSARSEEGAERLAKSVVSSDLVKASMFSCDPHWGRVMIAMGCSKAPFRPEHVDIYFRSAAGEVLACIRGEAAPLDMDKAKEILSQPEVMIDVDLHEGDQQAVCWGCDLTADYIKINGFYRS
ncbi:MAG: bifunctional glutamate N-acetyltransferase/amino-acid acetyltransferase ArgJ [Oscillospiraceae bacterium]|nr:bifunctional glutamate N-acetyltransferase/amino-acid acetyltransferase ArgJ [Oscillospiraceae bacterium]MCI9580315.1 bifunctional glutamate N-acetyltransferase/amino-acid acetyltransferase ArgJ [Oscillospiraceae bacterium]